MALPDNFFDGYLNITGNLAKNWQNKFSVPKLNINYAPKETPADQTPENIPAPSGTPAYVRKTFDKDEQFRKMYGTQASRRDRRRFEKYWNSDQRIADQRNFDAAEWDAWDKAESTRHKEFMDSIKDPNAIYEDWQKNQQSQAANQPAVETPTTPPVAPAPVAPTDWLAKAREYGFDSLDAVKKWQAENGLVADGKFGKNSLSKYNEIAQANQQAAIANSQTQPTTPTQPTPETPRLTLDDYKKSKYFRGVHGMVDGAAVTIDGKKYPIFVMQNRYTGTGKAKEENDRTYAVDPETGKMRRVFENWFGMPHNAWSTDEGGEDWFYPSFMAGPEYEWNKANPMPDMRGPLGGALTPQYKAWLEKYNAAKAVGFKKQGGLMQINKFQQGGTQPDIQQQVKQLVKQVAAGNKEAAAQVKQIMEAAKKGDEKALQIAKLIEQEIQAIQKDKQGAKINYIRHLKGKCPEGEELVYFKKGGLMTCGCQKKQNGAKLEKVNAVEKFKRRRRKA